MNLPVEDIRGIFSQNGSQYILLKNGMKVTATNDEVTELRRSIDKSTKAIIRRDKKILK